MLRASHDDRFPYNLSANDIPQHPPWTVGCCRPRDAAASAAGCGAALVRMMRGWGCRTQLTQIPGLQDSVAKVPCAPGTASSHTQSHDFPTVSSSSSISPGRFSHQALFFLHFWPRFSLDNFSQKGKRIFPPSSC